jgi:hypothetical protein
VILKDSHDFVFIEVRYPMEQPIDERLRVHIKVLAAAIHRDVIVSEAGFITVHLQTINQESLLHPTIINVYTRGMC